MKIYVKTKGDYSRAPGVIWTQQHTQEAELAVRLVERWGMVAAESDGEDSAGRQKLRLQTPEELADRAIDTARVLYEKLIGRGLMIDVTAEVEEYLAEREKK